MKKVKNKLVGTILSSAILFSFSCAEKPAKTVKSNNKQIKTEQVKTGWEGCLYPETLTKQEVKDALKPFLKGQEVFDVRKSKLPGLYEVILVYKDKVTPVYVDCNLENFIFGRIFDIKTKRNIVADTIEEYTPKTAEIRKKEIIKRIGKEKGEKLIKLLGKEGLKNLNFVNLDEIPKDHNVVLGNPNGKIVLYSIEEPECIHCAKFAPKMEKLLKKYKNIKLEVILVPWYFHPDGKKVIEKVICEKDPEKKVKILEEAFKATREGNKKKIKELGEDCKFGDAIAQRNWIFFKRNGIKMTPALILPGGIVVSDREVLEDEEKLKKLIEIVVS